MIPIRSASPSVATPRLYCFCSTRSISLWREAEAGLGSLPPKRVSCCPFIIVVSHLTLESNVISALSDTPYIGSIAILRWAFLMASTFNEFKMESI